MAAPSPQELQELNAALDNCRLCLDAGYEITPGAIYDHPHSSDVMLIGQAPGVTEVEARRPFNAGSGRRLFTWLEQAGWEESEFRATNVMTAVTKCYPGKARNGKGDRLPSRAEQRLCRPYLLREFALYRPRLIIPVGGLAIKLFFPPSLKLNQIIGTAAYFPPSDEPVSFDLGKAKHFEAFDPSLPGGGRWLVPLPHPSGASLWPNKPANKALIDRAAAILGDIRRAWEL
ncbi:MAG: uracil-DNA glycosylase family protein [Candidatus Promineifilaceae bacterium]